MLTTPEILSSTETLVTKIGGDNAGNLRANHNTIITRAATDQKQVVAISAIRSSSEDCNGLCHPNGIDYDDTGKRKNGFNTTSHLIALAKALKGNDKGAALTILEKVERFTQQVVGNEVRTDTDLQRGIAESQLSDLITQQFAQLREKIEHCDPVDLHSLGKDWVLRDGAEYFSITGFGEQLAQAIYQTYFRLKGSATGGLSLTGIAEEVYGDKPSEALESREKETQAVEKVRAKVREQIEQLLLEHKIILTGGYLPVLGGQRGYSDKTGALLAYVVQTIGKKVAYLIEKEFPIMSADPRKIPRSRLRTINRMTFALAREVFGNNHGADGGAIHPEALNMLAESDLATFVMNPAEPELGITHIHHYQPEPNGVEIIASRKVHLGIEIGSSMMIGIPGFLDEITGWLRTRNISIDQMATSEGTISLTFNNGGLTDEQIGEFSHFLQQTFGPDHEMSVESVKDKSLVFCLGNNMHRSGIAVLATLAINLARADIHFMSQGFNEQVMVFMVDTEQVENVVSWVHQVCVEQPERFGAILSGSSWRTAA